MVHKTCSLPNLPLGAGAAIGSFIRALYLTASNSYAIIGLSVDGLGFFDTLGANSAVVSDLIPMLTGKSYIVRQEVINAANKIADDTSIGAVYAVTVKETFSNEISRQSFSRILEGEDTDPVPLLDPIKLSVTFYIGEVTGILGENLVSAILHELPIDSTFVLPLACTGKHISKVWSTYVRHKFGEDLTIHVEGPNEQIVDADIAYLRKLYVDYVLKVDTSMQSFSTLLE